MKTDDNGIKEFFISNRPEISDNGEFMTVLRSRMEAVEEIKRIQRAEIRRCRFVVMAAFFGGILLGSAVITVILLHPGSVPQLDMSILSLALSLDIRWKYAILALLSASAIVLGLKTPISKNSL